MTTDATLFDGAYRPNTPTAVQGDIQHERGPNDFAGITHTPDRLQPWTVWHDGHVIAFCEDKDVAERILRQRERYG